MNPPSFSPFLQQIIPKLIRFYNYYNRYEFIENDPIAVPHRYADPRDIEISAFLVALITWGKRQNVIKAGRKMMHFMEDAPYDFILNFKAHDLLIFQKFVYRTFNHEDLMSILKILQKLYQSNSSLRYLFEKNVLPQDEHVGNGIIAFRNYFICNDLLPRTYRFFPDIEKGSAAKRINMYLRWMVRKDDRGVDFGIWQGISPSQLLVPLDIHTATVAREWGLLQRKSNDFKAVLELTKTLKWIDNQDPVKFDFALFGAGIFKEQPL